MHRTRTVVLGVARGLALLTMIGGTASCARATGTSSAASPSSLSSGGSPASPVSPVSPTSMVGRPVRDELFEFTVVTVQPHVARYQDRAARGEFVLVTVKVTNIGGQTRALDARSQVAYDTAGRKLANCEPYVYPRPKTFWDNIAPGESVSGTVGFDVPKGTRLTRVELHDSPASSGASVPV
jgi:hypothetical protein